jgi:hypothetical protein
VGILNRFFGRKEADDKPGAPLVANLARDPKLSLLLLFESPLKLDPAAVTRSLRKYHSSMSRASCELEPQTSADGTLIGLLGWGDHVVQLVGFSAPMPEKVVECCVEPAHYGAELKQRARAHRAHLIMYYAGHEDEPLEQYVALAAAAGALAPIGALLVVNEAAHTSFPAAALAAGEEDTMELLHSLPIPILYSGFVKYEVQSVNGVWMRTYGSHLLGLPDLAHLAKGHHEGEETFQLFSNLLSYLRDSGAQFAEGHTMEIGADLFVRARLPEKEEYFLENEGQLFVLEKIGRAEINR